MNTRDYDTLNVRMVKAIQRHDLTELESIEVELADDQQTASQAFRAFCRGSRERLLGNSNTSVEHLLSSCELFERCGRRDQVAAAHNSIGITHAIAGEFPLALQHSAVAAEIYHDIGDRLNTARIFGNMGAMHQNTGNYTTAIQMYHNALAIYEDLGERSGGATIIGNIGVVHFGLEEYDQALVCFRKALAVHIDLDERPSQARIHGNIGNVLSVMGNFSEALPEYRRSLELFHELRDPVGRASSVGNYIIALQQSGAWDEAREFMASLHDLVLISPVSHIRVLIARAKQAVYEDNEAHALELLQQALEIAITKDIPQSQADVHKELRQLARERGDFEIYLQHEDAVQRINKEMLSADTRRKVSMEDTQRKLDAERRESEKQRALLYTTLPPSIADRVLRGEPVNDSFDLAAVMFLDMVGFTSMSSSMSPDDLVRLLSDIFTACDAVVAEHGLMKIKTIGDSYMCVAFNNDAVIASARAARQMLHVVSDRFPQIRVRIGLHCGPVTAGIIGTERLQYDVWGDTVNVASRMESSGEPGRIHVSGEMAKRLRNTEAKERKGEMALLLRGEIDIKGKGLMETYWLDPS